ATNVIEWIAFLGVPRSYLRGGTRLGLLGDGRVRALVAKASPTKAALPCQTGRPFHQIFGASSPGLQARGGSAVSFRTLHIPLLLACGRREHYHLSRGRTARGAPQRG